MKRIKLTLVQQIVVNDIIRSMENEGHDVEELVALLQLTEEDIYERFKDRIWDLRDQFVSGLVDEGDDDMGEEEDDLRS